MLALEDVAVGAAPVRLHVSRQLAGLGAGVAAHRAPVGLHGARQSQFSKNASPD